jgi:hypothetical protein
VGPTSRPRAGGGCSDKGRNLAALGAVCCTYSTYSKLTAQRRNPGDRKQNSFCSETLKHHVRRKKSEVVPLQAMRALGGREGISCTLLSSAIAGGECCGQHHAPAALYPRGKSLLYPYYRGLGGPQSRSGCMRVTNNLYFFSVKQRKSIRALYEPMLGLGQ